VFLVGIFLELLFRNTKLKVPAVGVYGISPGFPHLARFLRLFEYLLRGGVIVKLNPILFNFTSHDGVRGFELAFADLLLCLLQFGVVVIFDLREYHILG